LKKIDIFNLNNQIEINNKDEFSDLVFHFNSLMRQLNKSSEELNLVKEKNFRLEKYQLLSNLSSGISHEINNPLNNISLFLEVLEIKNSDKDSKEVIKKINSEITKIKNIVSKFSEFSKISIEKSSVDLENLIDEIKGILYFEIFKKKVNIEFNNKIGLKKIKVNKEPLKFILINLLKNSIQAVEKNIGQITINYFKRNDKNIFEVIDNGKGIVETEKNIFEPFHTTKVEGTGLGLYITKRLVELCNGEIKSENINNKGAKFIVIL